MVDFNGRVASGGDCLFRSRSGGSDEACDGRAVVDVLVHGYIYGSEIARGVDVFKMVPNKFITQAEIDASNQVHFDELNVQNQPKVTWRCELCGGARVSRSVDAGECSSRGSGWRR